MITKYDDERGKKKRKQQQQNETETEEESRDALMLTKLFGL